MVSSLVQKAAGSASSVVTPLSLTGGAGGAAAPSGASGGTSSASTGDIVTGGSSKSGFPSIYWIGAALLVGAIAYRIIKKKV